ncbi:MerC domain-containing protein [Balneolales bacterium ANBcel1]|nr:MerC domain-containing protein [Balneolales bacterium ANBcel1]
MTSKHLHSTGKITLFGKISIALSSLCVVHCMATPFVLLFLPAISSFFSEQLEQILVLSVVPLSLLGFVPTWLRHKNYRLMALYLLSIGLILFSQFVLHVPHGAAGGGIHLQAWARIGVTFSGALLLAWVVFRNNRHTHYCTHPHHHQDTARPRPDPTNENITAG